MKKMAIQGRCFNILQDTSKGAAILRNNICDYLWNKKELRSSISLYAISYWFLVTDYVVPSFAQLGREGGSLLSILSILEKYAPQARNQKFFEAGVVSWNRGTSKNVSCTTYKKGSHREKNWCFFSKMFLKLHFK